MTGSSGDGTGAPNGGSHPAHVYAKPGTYTVRLTVTDSLGCSASVIYTGQTASCNGGPSATVTRTVTIKAKPVPKPKPKPTPKPARAQLSVSRVPGTCVRKAVVLGIDVATKAGASPHVTTVSVDGHQVAQSPRLDFRVKIPLARLRQGRNRVTVTSKDRFGRVSRTHAVIRRCASAAPFTG